jgi:DNA-binding response OmpR family regulator
MTRAKRILLVDDDDLLRDTLVDQFAMHDEFAVEAMAAAAPAIAKVKAEAHIDLVLLDIDLPDMDGRDACMVMRKNGFKSPIIMLTGADTDADTILGLNAGANDYVTKPFKFAVLLARVRAHLRSHEQNEDAIFRIGPYEFRPAVKMLVTENDRRIRLTEKETSILKFLYRAGGKPVTRDVLLDEVWGYNSGVTTHTLETHVYRLRQKIEPDPSNARLLVTESGGYRLSV